MSLVDTSIKRLIIEDADDELKGEFDGPLWAAKLDYMYVGRPISFKTNSITFKILELGKNLKVNKFPQESIVATIISDIEDPNQVTPLFPNTTYINVPLYVPKGTVDAYKQAEGWKNFFDIKENDGTVDKINAVKAQKDKGVSSYYDLSGQKVNKDAKGIIIIKYKDGSAKKILNK